MANLGRADLILEICDARLPASSRHPDLAEFFAQKPVWTILSKADLSDPKQNESWLQYAEGRGEKWLFMDLYAPADLKKLRAELKEFNQQFVAAAKSKGKRISPLKLIVVGIPNTGKSTILYVHCYRCTLCVHPNFTGGLIEPIGFLRFPFIG